jgi:antitoxin MazE
MITQIKEWGNSQGLRLNRQLLSDVGLAVGDTVDVEAENGVITISPTKSPRNKYCLQELVNSIPDNYNISEVDWGKPAGREAW